MAASLWKAATQVVASHQLVALWVAEVAEQVAEEELVVVLPEEG